MKPRLLDMSIDELRRAVLAAGAKAYRRDQLADWVYKVIIGDSHLFLPFC